MVYFQFFIILSCFHIIKLYEKNNSFNYFIFFLNFQSSGHVEHYKNYNYLEYELFRNNKLIGYHKYNFIKDDDNLTVKSEVNFKITKIGIDLYKYFAKSD